MLLFKRKSEEGDYEEDDFEEDKSLARKKFRDLKPENRKKRKLPPKPWGKGERFLIFFVLLATLLVSIVLSLSSKNHRFISLGLPNLTKILPNLSILKEETIVLGTDKVTPTPKATNYYEETISSFNQLASNLAGVYAFYVVNLDDGETFGVNENRVMQAASVIKAPIMAAFYLEAEKGNINLETKYTLRDADKRSGAGSLQYASSGKILTCRDLLRYMGKESDQTALHIVMSILGEDKASKLFSSLDMYSTSFSENTTTPKEMGSFFEKLWKGEVVSGENRDEILGFLTNTIYENWLSAGVPDGIRVAHKYGKEVGVVNDAGIVYAKTPYVVVIMSEGVNEQEANKVIPEMSKLIYTGEIR
jgi:beta-lactamase class A